MPEDTLQITGQRLCEKPLNKMELRWQVVEQLSAHCRKHLRPLYRALDFASTVPDNPWLTALTLMKACLLNNNGCRWGLRRSGTKNRVSVYHDAPLMTSTARYFLNQLAINDPSTYLHRGCFK